MVQLKTITIKHFFKKRFKLYIVLAYTFFLNHTFLKYVIVSYLDPLVFSPNNSFATKIKKINRHVVEN